MLNVKLNQLDRRYQLSESQQTRTSAINELTENLIRDYLPIALEKCGVKESHEVCIKEIALKLRLRESLSDEGQILQWYSLLEQAVRRALDQNDRSFVVYHSRVAALVDIAKALVTNNFERYWAWNQLGLLQVSEYPSPPAVAVQWLQRLSLEPEHIVPVLQTLARRSYLAPLCKKNIIHAEVLSVLGARLAQQYNLSFYYTITTREELNSFAIQDIEGLVAQIQRIQSSSVLLRELTQSGQTFTDPSVVLSIFAEVEPALMQRCSGRQFNLLINSFVRLVQLNSLQPVSIDKQVLLEILLDDTQAGTEIKSTDDIVEVETRPEFQHDKSDSLEVDSGLALENPELSEPADESLSSKAYIEELAAKETGDLTTAYSPSDEIILEQEPQSINLEAPIQENDFESGLETNETLSSRWGGLLYLLNLIKRDAFLTRLDSYEVLAARPLGWVLEQMAVRILGCEADDLAIRIFSASICMDETWMEQEGDVKAKEESAIQDLVNILINDFNELLGGEKKALPLLRHTMFMKRIQIEFDCNWVDVYFDLESVDHDIRRAGLDLDPDYVACLGLIIRFHYQ